MIIEVIILLLLLISWLKMIFDDTKGAILFLILAVLNLIVK